MTLSKRLRFEVFKRDKFTCQYCGKKAPDIVLHVDHQEPRAEGGTDDFLNLFTSCVDCNLGKSDKRLSDDSVIAMKRDQLAMLEERREQIEMMMEWQRSLSDLDGQILHSVADRWCELVDWQGVNEIGQVDLKKWIRQFGVEEVLVAMRAAVDGYYVKGEDPDGSETAFNKIGGICATTRAQKEKPYLRDLYYVRKIVQNRCTWYVHHDATDLLDTAYSWDASTDELKRIAQRANSWSRWKTMMYDYIIELKESMPDEPSTGADIQEPPSET